MVCGAAVADVCECVSHTEKCKAPAETSTVLTAVEVHFVLHFGRLVSVCVMGCAL